MNAKEFSLFIVDISLVSKTVHPMEESWRIIFVQNLFAKLSSIASYIDSRARCLHHSYSLFLLLLLSALLSFPPHSIQYGQIRILLDFPKTKIRILLDF